MAKIAFTDPTIRNLPPPVKGQRSFWDENLSGFGIRVSQGGTRTWIVMDPRAKVRTHETIGRYPVISLADARTEAKRRLAEATLGKHRPRSVTWSKGLDEYLKVVEARCKPGTYLEYKRLLQKYFKFGDTRLAELSPHDLHKKLNRVSGSEGRHAFVAVRAFLNWAYKKHYVDVSPLSRMEVPQGSTPRERVLTDEELAKIWRACGDEAFGVIVKLLILTGQRRGEIAYLSPCMIGEDRITLPSWLTKNSREHAIPLQAEAAQLLKQFEGAKAKEPILGVRVGDALKAFSAWGKSKKALDKACGVSDWTLHDLRRTFASGLAAQGVLLPVIERLLNHVSGSFGGIVGVYQRYDFMPEMRTAMARWETKVLELTSADLRP
ncbi:MAG TPA: tyrosine-type recombinase/integrase [Hyphomonadaceae bacterium]|nr:tyrosine-type recombinase/integrase [Hyphomonadaceae bacterium]